MARLPDAPLNEPVPPPVEFRLPSRKTCRWIVFTIIFVMAVAGVIYPFFIKRSRGRDWAPYAATNLRQIGLALFEFENAYGSYPDAITIDAVRKSSGSDLPLGTKTSNDFLRQLIASGMTRSESMFYAKIRGSKKPDNLIDASNALVKGEVGFSYLSGLSSAGDPTRPIAVTPLIPGTDRFDPKPFKGKAVILRIDSSVSSMTINKNGHVMEGRWNLLDPAHPMWGGKPPVIVWPDL
ncbi:MAG: hypothetical protein V4584_15145 [Verrucomicrobiota bacterium]